VAGKIEGLAITVVQMPQEGEAVDDRLTGILLVEAMLHADLSLVALYSLAITYLQCR